MLSYGKVPFLSYLDKDVSKVAIYLTFGSCCSTTQD